MNLRFIRMLRGVLPILGLAALAGCESAPQTLFQLKSPTETGIDFSNEIIENDTLNILEFEYVYNGGGVGIADFNQDGQLDVVFSGNQVANRLYLNQGGFSFQDITEPAGIAGADRWCMGVTVADVNGDNWPDIYFSASVKQPAEARANLLYIHQGLDDAGIPVFKEMAAEYGINDMGHSTHAAFLDYDLDGDLDLYVLTNEMQKNRKPNSFHKKKIDGSEINSDRFYRNNGDGTFTNVSIESGITIEGYGLGINITDVNLDGYPDLYITNDYLTNDLFYLNNGDGTFTNHAADFLKHQSYSAMGNDVADINHDGLVDLVALDMLPETNERRKQMVGSTTYQTYINNEKFGYEFQFVRNTLQLNQGANPTGMPAFSEISQLSGIHRTDWSWSPLFGDYDLDGETDLLITNGFPRDVTDLDFGFYRVSKQAILETKNSLQELIPVVKISNYAYRNLGELQFEDATQSWGLSRPSFSHGAAFADLDGDGDLDYVVNNMNDAAFVYENTARNSTEKPAAGHYLTISLEGTGANTDALGAKVYVYAGGKVFFHEHHATRGYMSSVSPEVHVGLGAAAEVDSLQVIWPDRRETLMEKVPVDQHLTLKQSDAQDATETKLAANNPWLTGSKEILPFLHDELDRVDFNIQRTIPHKLSEFGPALAVGDLNGDGWDDVVLGGSAGRAPQVYAQSKSGDFTEIAQQWPETFIATENQSLALLDLNGDGHLDLFAANGSYEFRPESAEHQDQLFLNDGNGVFREAAELLPTWLENSRVVSLGDLDQDGDLDVFVGGGVIPGAYPQAYPSRLLVNIDGKLVDQTEAWCPELKELGLVSDAVWSDYDGDGKSDLMIVGEWMPITVFHREGESLVPMTDALSLGDTQGWWNAIEAADLDGDGDMDYVLGNLGKNTTYCATLNEPMTLLAKDFDNNGSVDPIMFCFGPSADGVRKSYPVAPRLDMIKQINLMRGRYKTFAEYGQATIDDVFTPEELEGAMKLEAFQMASGWLENAGSAGFIFHEFPLEAQFAPITDAAVGDADGDGAPEILLVGNRHDTETFTGKYDAFNGIVLKNDQAGNWEAIPAAQSGWWVPGAASQVMPIRLGGKDAWIAVQREDHAWVFTRD
ncbi:VCBS repeat-containing protein [Pontibacter sp. G13]|uniref:VCBS repeat-containing protein n=1 Tax=Pontibacter sp. G13 TaxID=3074898 RepID=UPI00288BB880|nr:VCBS repeat-containing protein [Pontibacter sp. G13]WNJ17662.1 VCBS repeat-containing protein [Pontibacter sp. G13]